MRRLLAISVAGTVLLGVLAGCQRGGMVYVSVIQAGQPQQPQAALPNVRDIVVLPLAPKDPQSIAYAESSANMLAARLIDLHGSVDLQQGLIRPVSLRDPAIAGCDLADPATAVKAAKAFNAQAALFGTILVQPQDLGGAPPRRAIAVTMVVKMIDPNTGQPIMPDTTLQASQEPAPSAGAAPGLLATDEATTGAMRQCVAQLGAGGGAGAGVATPVECLGFKLAGGKSKLAKNAIKLAEAGQYDQASLGFQQAIDENPEDHGSVYNLGLVILLNGDLAGGRAQIAKAIQMKEDKLYVSAAEQLDRLAQMPNVQVRAATPQERAQCERGGKKPKKQKTGMSN